MSSTTSPKVDTDTSASKKSKLPKQKITAITRLKTFGTTFKRRNHPPPALFPPPSWDLDDEAIRTSRLDHTRSPPPLDLPEPDTFVKNLKFLIDSATNEETGSSLSPEPVPPGLDNNLVRMLASEDVMNGGHATSAADETQKKGNNIWNILASLKTGNNAVERLEVGEEDGGLMMYAPLEPKVDSQVELAVESVVQPDTAQPRKAVVEKHVWVPSTTELSVLTAWWGYRVYLPPPVMDKLDSKAIKATTRAAMIATALKWLLEKIPLAIIPVQFRPAVKLLKQLGPLTGYIGVFVAWSWDRVRSLDEGNGVVLTATWLLPVALLPMAWDAGTIYRPNLLPKPEELKKMKEEAAKAAEEERKAAKKVASSSLGQTHQGGERKKSWFRW